MWRHTNEVPNTHIIRHRLHCVHYIVYIHIHMHVWAMMIHICLYVWQSPLVVSNWRKHEERRREKKKKKTFPKRIHLNRLEQLETHSVQVCVVSINCLTIVRWFNGAIELCICVLVTIDAMHIHLYWCKSMRAYRAHFNIYISFNWLYDQDIVVVWHCARTYAYENVFFF